MLNVMNKPIHTLLIMLCATALLAAAQEATAPALPPEAQTALERGLSAVKQGEWELAIKYFSQAQKAAPESPEALFNLALASARAEGRDIPAIAWFRAYLAAAPKAPNAQQVRTQILDLEIKVEGTIGKLIRFAKDTAAHIPPDNYRKPEAYSEIAQAQARAGDIAGAKEMAARITEDYYQASAYRGIAQAQARAGDIAGAKETAARIAGIPAISGKSSAYSEIAQAQYKVSAEIKSWTNLAIHYQEQPRLVNLGAFVESLKKELEPSEIMRPPGGDSAKGPYSIAEALARAVRDLASALKELRDMEVEWQKLRAQSTP